ncbi:MAG: tetratricopeptide repeat protein [Candidatus Competibacteraceae bacterium]|nr:MAG: tetratricopeptide repeat protein [Candidatus Competibacteraceae bacterium]
MPDRRPDNWTSTAWPFVLLLAALLAIGALYGLALPGYWLFDDEANLAGLAEIRDWRSAWLFATSGDAGPLGRPLALATFAVQAAAWDQDPAAMLRVNIAVHLAAVWACFLLAAGLARVRAPEHLAASSWWIGLAVAVVWGLSPFLATSHLMIIQRMTSLSGLFVLLGLAAFVWAHWLDGRHRRRVWILLACGLGLGTLLAALSKESGALLPVLAALILWLWIPRERRLRDGFSRILIVLLIVVPSLALFSYLASLLPTILDLGYGAYRDFTPVERLMSQPLILLDYARHLLFPQVAAVSPFMDRLPAPRGWLDPPGALLAALFWPALLLIAVRVRKRAPVFLFGLAFFLAGHLLESSFIGLELYFAHRNYVPSFGLYFALTFAVFQLATPLRRLAFAGLAVYGLLFALVLGQVTAGWNNKQLNGELWFVHNPHSVRAAQFLGRQYLAERDYLGARRVLDIASERHPDGLSVQLQRTGLCIGREAEYPALLQEVTESFRTSTKYEPVAAMRLVRLVQEENHSPLCPLRDLDTLERLADAMLENPLYRDRAFSRSLLVLTKAFINREAGNLEVAVDFFVEAFRQRPELEVAFFAASLMADLEDHAKAYRFLEEVRERVPSSRLAARIWLEDLAAFEHVIRASERVSRGIEPAT